MEPKIFARTIDPAAQEQIKKMSQCEAYKDCEICIMPDVHAGKGCTVGTVIKIKDKIVPNTVGVDIGCGMTVLGLGKIHIDLQKLDEVINTKIPSGFASHDEPIVRYPWLCALHCAQGIKMDYAMRQIGTLGGGNHFIEIDQGSSGYKYLVIHSGSRNLGVQVCNYYQSRAKESDDMRDIRREIIDRLKSEGREKEIAAELAKVKKARCEKELAYIDGELMKQYLDDMEIVQNYASLNRGIMAKIICDSMGWSINERFETIHNYIDIESGILRKGAVRASNGEMLIIPINMRDGSFLCYGKGNDEWLQSAPHGAGRVMSRSEARKNLSMDDYKREMQNVYSTSVCEDTIDEAPMAYKSKLEILTCIRPTVTVMDTIKPIYNFKAKS